MADSNGDGDLVGNREGESRQRENKQTRVKDAEKENGRPCQREGQILKSLRANPEVGSMATLFVCSRHDQRALGCLAVHQQRGLFRRRRGRRVSPGRRLRLDGRRGKSIDKPSLVLPAGFMITKSAKKA